MIAGWIASGLLLAYGAMVALCLGLDRHYRQVWGVAAALGRYRLLRGLGWLGLALSLLCMVAAWGWAMGPVAWIGALSVAGLVLTLALPWWPRLAVASAIGGPLLSSAVAVAWVLA
jgi:hypothetical protein